MNFLTEFSKNFWDSSIVVRPYFSSPTRQSHAPIVDPVEADQQPHEEDDVVTDLVSNPVAAACLPIAKQISVADQVIKFKLPQIGDLFVGILHIPIISRVNFKLHNYSEEIEIEGLCQEFKGQCVWTLSKLPLPLVCINDWTHCYIEVEIELNENYNLQVANQDVFKAYFGYFQRSILYQLINQVVYKIPLHNGISNINIVAGLWTI
jgi:hypothetical protein